MRGVDAFYAARQAQLDRTTSTLKQGKMRGFDQLTNIILSDCVERVFGCEPEEDDDGGAAGASEQQSRRTRPTYAGVEERPCGLYLIRGDDIVLVGAVDEELDGSIEWSEVRVAALPPARN
jgi:U6 snRNA-associated Sm-like protein LSm8